MSVLVWPTPEFIFFGSPLFTVGVKAYLNNDVKQRSKLQLFCKPKKAVMQARAFSVGTMTRNTNCES